MVSLYEDADFREKVEQEEPYEGLTCDECGRPIDYYYYIIDDYVYCDDCMNSHLHHI